MKGARRTLLAGVAGTILLWAATAGASCPQPRATAAAPETIAQRQNPLPPSGRNLRAGKALYRARSGSLPACATCHGRQGDGDGPLASQFTPPPRNFTCAPQLAALSDGQLFWIIREGSPGTSMPAFPLLSEEQAWQLVAYLRTFAR